MGKSSKAPAAPAPDPNIGLAALKQAELGVDWLNEAKVQFGIANERQGVLDALTTRVTEQQLGASEQAQKWATDDRKRYVDKFQPLQDEFIDTARNWDSTARQETLAAEAKADVMTAAQQGRATQQRQSAAMGINPASGRYAGIERAGEMATALASAGAQNNARTQVRQQALGLKGEAINLGSGLAVNPGASLQIGIGAGNAAVGNATSANVQARANAGILQNGYQTAMGGYQSQAGILGQQYGQQLSAWNAQTQASAQKTSGLFSGLGQIAGAALPFMLSSEKAKEDKRPVEGALDAVMAMPVEEWAYKPGQGDGARHIGPYAEDFTRATGQGDGKTIDIISAIGLTMKATQELAQEVRSMQRGRGVMPERPAARKPRGMGIMPDQQAA